MNSNEFRELLLKKTPKYSISVEHVFQKLANKMGKGEYSQFGPLYELYIYAFYLGIKIKRRIELPSGSNAKKFVEIGGWKANTPLIDFFLLTVFSYSDEIGFDWNDLEEMDENQINDIVRKIISFIEEYAYGGLDFIREKLDNSELDDSQYLFIDLMNEAIEIQSL